MEYLLIISGVVVAALSFYVGYAVGKAHGQEQIDAAAEELAECKETLEVRNKKFSALSDELDGVRTTHDRKVDVLEKACDDLREELERQTSYAQDFAAKCRELEGQLAGQAEIASAQVAVLRADVDRLTKDNVGLSEMVRDLRESQQDFGIQPTKKPKKRAKA